MDSALVADYSRLEQTHWWFVVRRRILEQVLGQHADSLPGQSRILNIGAASGFSSQWLSRFGDVTSVENDAAFLAHLQKTGQPAVEASAENMPFPDQAFDLVCAFDVLEHLDDDHLAYREMLRVCKPGGLIFIAVPAGSGLWSPHDEVNGHRRRYSLRSLRELTTSLPCREIWTSHFNTLLYVPIALVRKGQRFFRRKETLNQSDFVYYRGSGFVNSLLQWIFSLEVGWLKKRRFSFGVSLLLLVQKTTEHSKTDKDQGK